ncbi:hypothetical protein J437_LFUL008905 [Ladona fulva]|uniref:Peptidase S1 domain-containing protein n=1 Tax=Ladona fulva TaxID=123851 RepID=A0A8K0K681_LADFU|nr:hypothetical protein J437_LFUL008905 [Ladona fulva]
MRIVGGIEAGVNEFPMMAALANPVTRRPICGATIISRRYAVTAAHCLSLGNPDRVRLGLLVGEHDISTDEETTSAKLYNITQIIIHPNYKNVREGNDIALVKVGHSDADGIQFGKNVGPVCLPFRYLTESFSAERVIALGWGVVKFEGVPSDALKVSFLSVEPLQSCIEAYKGKVNYGQICTLRNRGDTCKVM